MNNRVKKSFINGLVCLELNMVFVGREEGHHHTTTPKKTTINKTLGRGSAWRGGVWVFVIPRETALSYPRRIIFPSRARACYSLFTLRLCLEQGGF